MRTSTIKRLFIFLFLFLYSIPVSSQEVIMGIHPRKVGGQGGGPSNFAYVAASVTGCFNANPAQTTCTYALHHNPTAGNLLILGAFWNSASCTGSVTGTNSDTWTAIGSPKVGIGGLAGFSAQMFKVASSAGSATTVTLTISCSQGSMGWEMAEYSYTGTISGFDGTPAYSNTTGSSNTVTTGTVTTTNSSDLVSAHCLAIGTDCTAVGTGYTFRNDTNACKIISGSCTTAQNYNTLTGGLLAEKTGATAGAQQTTFSTGATADVNILGLVAF